MGYEMNLNQPHDAVMEKARPCEQVEGAYRSIFCETWEVTSSRRWQSIS